MAINHSFLAFALKDGVLTNIDDVERGLKCGCVCPSCNEPLIAKKGNIHAHHFSHCKDSECTSGYQTSLHLLAKEIIAETKSIMLPKLLLRFDNTKKKPYLLNKPVLLHIDDVYLEKRFDDFIPDIVAVCKGKTLLIEIYVTHKVDNAKLKKILDSNVSVIEIDLSQEDRLISKNELSDILHQDNEKKSWLYNSKANKVNKELFSLSKKRTPKQVGWEQFVYGCPKHVQDYKGTPCANAMDDCACSCPYCIGYFPTITENADDQQSYGEYFVYCTGDKQIDTYDDLKEYLNKHKSISKRGN